MGCVTAKKATFDRRKPLQELHLRQYVTQPFMRSHWRGTRAREALVVPLLSRLFGNILLLLCGANFVEVWREGGKSVALT
jgi:hypothetical protein